MERAFQLAQQPGAGESAGQPAEDHHREQQQTAGEDDGHDAGLIDAQRQVLASSAVDPAAADVLGALRGNPPLPLADKHDAGDHADEKHDQDQEHVHAQLALAAAQLQAAAGHDRLDDFADGAGQPGQNIAHDQKTDAVADAVLVDLLAQPHEEYRAGGHRQNGNELPGDLQAEGRAAAVVAQELGTDHVLAARKPKDIEPALPKAEKHGGVAGILIDLLPPGLALLLQLFQRRIDARQKLEDNRGGNVGHDAQTEDGRLPQLAAAEDGHLIEQIGSASAAAEALLQHLMVEDRQGNV